MPFVPFGEFLPDQPDYENPGSSLVQNVYARSSSSYGPVPALASAGLALSARCQGAIGLRNTDGNAYDFAGDATKLYFLNAGAASWTDVSQSGGYNISADQQWHFTLFNSTVIATEITDPIQSYVIGTSSKFADLANGNVTGLAVVAGSGYTNGTNYALTASGGGGSGFAGLIDVSSGALTNARITTPGKGYTSAPTIAVPAGAGAGTGGSITPTVSTIAPSSRYAAIVRNFLMAGNTSDATNGARPQRLWWSAIGDPTNWPTLGTSTAASVQSDAQDVTGDHGWLTGIVPNVGPIDAAVFMQGAVFRVMYVGAPDTFSILPAHGAKGCLAPGSIVNTPLGVFYLGPDGVYLFDGQQSIPIGYGKVNNYLFGTSGMAGTLNTQFLLNISACLDPLNPIVWLAFCSSSNTSGVPDTVLVCNLGLTSVIGTPGVFTILPSFNCELLFRAVSLGFTLEQLDHFGTLEQLPASLDSQVWQGNGQFLLAAFDSSHNLSFFTGNNLAPTVQTSEYQPIEGKRARVKGVIPIVDGGAPSVAPITRNRQIDATVKGTAVAVNADGYCPLNCEGRFMRYQMTLAANSSFTHMKGIVVPDEMIVDAGTR